jgi:hypothetical protein
MSAIKFNPPRGGSRTARIPEFLKALVVNGVLLAVSLIDQLPEVFWLQLLLPP